MKWTAFQASLLGNIYWKIEQTESTHFQMLCGKDSTAHAILRSLLKEKWSIRFKLYKRKKPHIVNVQFTELLAKPIKETHLKKPIDCKLNWKSIGGNLYCFTELYNDHLKFSFLYGGMWSTKFICDGLKPAAVMPFCPQNRSATPPIPVWFFWENLYFVLKHEPSDFSNFIVNSYLEGMAELSGQTVFWRPQLETCTIF